MCCLKSTSCNSWKRISAKRRPRSSCIQLSTGGATRRSSPSRKIAACSGSKKKPKGNHRYNQHEKSGALLAALQRFEDGGYLAAHAVVGGDFGLHLFPAVHDGGMIAPAQFR